MSEPISHHGFAHVPGVPNVHGLRLFHIFLRWPPLITYTLGVFHHCHVRCNITGTSCVLRQPRHLRVILGVVTSCHDTLGVFQRGLRCARPRALATTGAFRWFVCFSGYNRLWAPPHSPWTRSPCGWTCRNCLTRWQGQGGDLTSSVSITTLVLRAIMAVCVLIASTSA